MTHRYQIVVNGDVYETVVPPRNWQVELQALIDIALNVIYEFDLGIVDAEYA